LIQPERLSDSIVAEQVLAADFFNSIGQNRPSGTAKMVGKMCAKHHERHCPRAPCMKR
jgi:hypothetical protein